MFAAETRFGSNLRLESIRQFKALHLGMDSADFQAGFSWQVVGICTRKTQKAGSNMTLLRMLEILLRLLFLTFFLK